MVIEGYEDGPVSGGEPLLGRPGFWSNHLLGLCRSGPGDEPPGPEWFGDDPADTDALSEVLLDPGRWPVLRVTASEGPGILVVYRNLVGDSGIDFLLVPEGGGRARLIARWEEEVTGTTGLTWPDLVGIADSAAPVPEGVQDPAARLLLILPLLGDPDLPETASARVGAALTAVGAPADTAAATARHLLDRLTSGPRHGPAWRSPLSGG